jgi:pimeloyl-ACP methyl ester carboxylesterase
MVQTKSAAETYLRLNDGRRLCYAEYGDPAGKPVFLFHGNPNSRLLWGLIPDSPFLPGLRLIAPDRPGFGRTEFREGVTTVENWPCDVRALADSLGIEKFAVFAASGGGPFALSCAWKIPERLTAVGVFACVGPFVPSINTDLARPLRALWSKAGQMPGVLKLQMRLFAWLARRLPGVYVRTILHEFGATDREVYDRLHIARLIRTDRVEGYRQGGIGSWYDVTIPGDWSIPLEEITVPALLWQGEEDISVPPSMGRYLAENIPKCESTFIGGAGHFWIFEHLPEMLAKLVGS